MPYAGVGPIKVPQGLSDEQVLFLSDIFPTAYMASEHCRNGQGPDAVIKAVGLESQGATTAQSVISTVLAP